MFIQTKVLTNLFEDMSNSSASDVNSGSINMIAEFLTLGLIFIFILVLSYYTTKLVGTSRNKMMSKGNIKFIESLSIGINQLHIIKVGSQYFLISSSKEGIRMMSELSQENIINNEFESYLDKINKSEKNSEKNNMMTGFAEKVGFNKVLDKKNNINNASEKEEKTNEQEK